MPRGCGAALPAVAPSPVTGELYLPLLVELAAADGATVVADRVADDGTLMGVNDRVQLGDRRGRPCTTASWPRTSGPA